ncbi:MAG: hypothetical protein LAT62_11270 [Natronospirillum sp.]|uniref:hypothetical protein n=1 Tax=Natronospirillum sp. TaxID=2812955 RepID=UPI0025F449D6|nr:hypothetical protein [Natronospirillum sp.]MCH8552510.1 hypothetical protein [Natronospirillum sp.]
MKSYFVIEGSRRVEFPQPELGLQENKKLLSQHFPMLRNTTVYEEDAEVQGEDILYPIYLPPAKTNG